MSDAANKMPLAAAEALAQAIVADLRPGCSRIEIAGSIRRRRPTVNDLEIVAIPRHQQDLFGGEGGDSLLNPILEQFVQHGRLARVKGGEKYRQYEVLSAGNVLCKLDLFLCDFLTWGVIFTLRTGPAEFSKRLVTDRQHGGLCPSYLRFKDGRIWHRDGTLYGTPEEGNIFSTLGLAWINPEDRK